MSSPKPAERHATQAATAPTGATTEDAFLGGGITVQQPLEGHRAGLDAVFLAASVEADASGRLLDLGTGVGVAALAALSRAPGLTATGIDSDASVLALARDNAAANGVAERTAWIAADVAAKWSVLEAAGLARDSFDHAIANPPFFRAGTVRASPSRAPAHVLGDAGLAPWIATMTTALRPGGMASLVLHAGMLPDALACLARRFGGVTVFPLFPAAGKPAIRLIVRGVKGGRAPLKVCRGMVLHGADGAYTGEAQAVLRAGAGLGLPL